MLVSVMVKNSLTIEKIKQALGLEVKNVIEKRD